MLDLQCDLDVQEHLAGMYVLAAHHDARVRGFVQTHMLAGLTKLSSFDDIDCIPNFWSLLDTWVRLSVCQIMAPNTQAPFLGMPTML